MRKLCGARHIFTPPRWPKANADVEAVHRLIEEEFFGLENFAGTEDFLQHYFNFARTNSYRRGRTPWEIAREDHPEIRPASLALPPVLLEAEFLRLDEVGQDVSKLDAAPVRSA